MAIVFDHSTLGQRILFGTGEVLNNVQTAVSSIGAQRILLIAGNSAAEVSDAIAEKTPVVARICDVVQHVPAENVNIALAITKEENIDLVIAIGGGSAVGLAKIIARETGISIVAVPTTFSGSEATSMWGMTKDQRKTTGLDQRVLPKVVVYDALLMSTLPSGLAMASGMNAIAHAVDGFWAPNADPISIAMGTEGIRALVPGLKALATKSTDIEAWERTIYGAYLAAVAFATSGSGLHHKICHTLGGTFNLPHAETHAVMIGYVAEFNGVAAADVASRISESLGATTPGKGFSELQRSLKTPASLKEIGFAESEIAAAVNIILPSVPPSNPRAVTKENLANLLHAAWAGEPLS
jgi:maleylacetate reductase